MAKGIREREFQNLMIQWSLPMGWDYTAGRSLQRETTQTVIAGQLSDAIVRLNPGVIDGFDVDAVVEEIVATVNAVEGGLVRANEQVLRLLRGQRSSGMPTACGTPSRSSTSSARPSIRWSCRTR